MNEADKERMERLVRGASTETLLAIQKNHRPVRDPSIYDAELQRIHARNKELQRIIKAELRRRLT